jgi:hypothetical protein
MGNGEGQGMDGVRYACYGAVTVAVTEKTCPWLSCYVSYVICIKGYR